MTLGFMKTLNECAACAGKWQTTPNVSLQFQVATFKKNDIFNRSYLLR
jgi:hypothetical protein